ncbi:hypothetical protein EMIT0232MI5_30418 [Pseudomonas sp. IT-232MI5]
MKRLYSPIEPGVTSLQNTVWITRTLSLETQNFLSTCQPLSTNFPALWLTLSRGFPTPYHANNPRGPRVFQSTKAVQDN